MPDTHDLRLSCVSGSLRGNARRELPVEWQACVWTRERRVVSHLEVELRAVQADGLHGSVGLVQDCAAGGLVHACGATVV